MTRCTEPGYVRVGTLCTAGRRSLWMRADADGSIDLCAGREGDDAHVRIDPGHPQFRDLADVMFAAEFAATCPRCGARPVGSEPFAFAGDGRDMCSACPGSTLDRRLALTAALDAMCVGEPIDEARMEEIDRVRVDEFCAVLNADRDTDDVDAYNAAGRAMNAARYALDRRVRLQCAVNLGVLVGQDAASAWAKIAPQIDGAP